MVIPLTNLLKKATKFDWSDKCEQAFQDLKKPLSMALVITLLEEGKEYTIYIDASK